MAKDRATDATKETYTPPKGRQGMRMNPVCPTNGEHRQVRIYKTLGRVRYCACDDCGATWKVTGAPYSPQADYLQRLAERLRKAAETPTQIGDGVPAVVITPGDALKTAAQLDDISTQVAFALGGESGEPTDDTAGG